MLTAAKDAVASRAAKSYLNNFIERYGRIDDLKIDSKRNRIEVVCQLIGEPEPIGVTIERYRVDDKGAKKVVQVLDSSATRPWLQSVMRDHLHGREFEVPSWAASAL